MKKLVILDGNALIHRAFHALPELKTKQGELVNAVYGFTSILFNVIQELKPDYLAATFDLAGPTFRDLEYKDYKAKRVKHPQELYDQIPQIKEIVKALKISIYEKKGFEADDVIGTIVSKVSSSKHQVLSVIITGDLDLLQLVDKNTEVHTPKKGIKNIVVYDLLAVKERYNLKPKQIIDLKGLRGDASDNIPGVPGIGEKTALKLIGEFGSLEKLYQDIESSNLEPKLKARLLEYKKDAFFSKRLVTIKKDVPFDFDLKKCQWGNCNKRKALDLLKKFEFKSLIKRLEMLK
jgi:DNA polymerase I